MRWETKSRGSEGEDCKKRWLVVSNDLGGGFKHFLFSPLPGEMIHFD